MEARLIDPEEINLNNKKLIVGKIVKVKECYLTTETGGGEIVRTSDIGEQAIEVEIIKSWYDYETGENAKAKVLNERIIKRLKEIGKAKYTAEHYKQYGEESYQRVLDAKSKYNPSIVSVSEWDLI